MKKFWESLVPEVTAVVYTQDYGRPMPRRMPYRNVPYLPPPQSDMAFVLARGRFMRPNWDQPYWRPNDLTKPPRWRPNTHHGIELVNSLVDEEIVESAYVTDNYITVLTGDRAAEDWQDRMLTLYDRVGETAMILSELAGSGKVVDYTFLEGNITDPRRFLD
ncbi:MAG: hypothetical protein JWM37_813 [Candidatus Saccharibacteria bacterium]|nr:hypothetical protein [Candidatus Saccharibacteria bacterium]